MLQPPIRMHPPLAKHDAVSLSVLVHKNNFVFVSFEQLIILKNVCQTLFCEPALFHEGQEGRDIELTPGH